MKLSEFIRANIEEISAQWEKFAATLLPNEEFSASVLRDGIAAILKEIALDMEHSQSAEEQQEKSEGAQDSLEDKDNAAETHALARVRMGLSSRQLISEFRALRATVLRLWDESNQAVSKSDLYDITRFNEAVDQALTEAAVRYSEKIEQSRELFLGILAHDLRTPLAAISGFAHLLVYAKNPDRNAEFASQILISAGRMGHMIADLMELTRVQLGSGISVNRSESDIVNICSNVITEMRAVYPERVFKLDADKSLRGKWDEPKLEQVLSNLLGNAVQHGARNSVITVKAKKLNDSVEFQVHNEGPAVPKKLLPVLFDRFVQGKSGFRADEGRAANLGLGLYIAKEIIVAHGGTLKVRSTDKEGTTFSANLPLTIP
jgi:signal transduction histidine kinase